VDYSEDATMRSLKNTLLISGTLSAILLVSNLAYATPKNSAVFEKQIPQYSTSMLFIPQLESEGRNKIHLSSQKTVDDFAQSFLSNPSSKEITHKSCGTKKKNRLYELSAIFNDKLQLFLAHFAEPKTYKLAKALKNKNNPSASIIIPIK